jgi:hypothetical protein
LDIQIVKRFLIISEKLNTLKAFHIDLNGANYDSAAALESAFGVNLRPLEARYGFLNFPLPYYLADIPDGQGFFVENFSKICGKAVRRGL